jgi:hypothetical protein
MLSQRLKQRGLARTHVTLHQYGALAAASEDRGLDLIEGQGVQRNSGLSHDDSLKMN